MLKRLLLAATLMLSPAVASAKWHEASSAHFVVYSDQDPEKLRAFATKLELFDKTMRYSRGTPDKDVGLANRLTVYVVSNMDAVERLAGMRNIAGFYVPRATGSFAFVPRRAGSGAKYDLNADIVFFHEYAHHFMLGNYPGAVPAWYAEGFAEFYSTARVGDDGVVDIGVPAYHRARELNVRDALPMAKMLNGDHGPLSPEQTGSLYGRGWALMHYLTSEPARAGQLDTYVRLLGVETSPADAARTAFGDVKQLDRELAKYLGRPKIKVRSIGPGLKIGPVSVRALTPGEAAFMPVRMRSVRGVDAKTAAALVPDARRAAAAHPADPVVQGWLAEVEHDANNLDASLAAAERALGADPNHGQALIYKGRVRMKNAVAARKTDKATWAEARRWFVKASQVDTEDAEPKMLYYQSFRAANAKPTANAVDALVYAQKLVPQDGGLRMEVVRQHLIDGKVADARRMLAPLAFSPHAGTGRNRAAALMARLVANDAAGGLALANAVEKPEAAGD